jgi:gliding motility associated protien GldN
MKLPIDLTLKIALLGMVSLTIVNTCDAQTSNNSSILNGALSTSNNPRATVVDGMFEREINKEKTLPEYPSIREADVMYAKKIWQFIDIREKINQQLYFPLDIMESSVWKRRNLWDSFLDLVDNGWLVPYSPYGPDLRPNDTFLYPMSPDQIKEEFFIREINQSDPSANWTDKQKEDFEIFGIVPSNSVVTYDTTYQAIPGKDIVGYKLKEEWIWDKQRAQSYKRIIGIAPMVIKKTASGQSGSTAQELCWFYYPEARHLLKNYDSYNPMNIAATRSFAEIFELRLFSSYIIKEFNVYDREINDYARGLDAIAESERIKEELFILEHDLWHY